MPTSPEPATLRATLRRAVLAVVVVDDLDLLPGDDGVQVPVAGGDPLVPWTEVAAAAGAPAGPASARLRVRDWVLAHRTLQEEVAAGTDPWALLLPLALPVTSAAHLGPAWASRPVLGGAMDLGLGVRLPFPPPGAQRVVPLPRPVAARVGLGPDADGGQPSGALSYLERMGEYAAQRLRRDKGVRGGGVLRPVGGCDVPTLLAAESLRSFVVGDDECGMRAVAVPRRERGWFDLARVDPAFVGAAWSATEVEDRAFPRAVLVTRHEVAMPEPTLDLTRQSLEV
ncbi:hypothetical protein CLV92_1056 [Kineococcus xinjiangensis]|uniref:Uncharacterized protein n=1 Tax=Kineococcus xinjiangensis TaxID=512762 RepID=A0A2S6INS4_9ACTN|nr:hypothetical protein [Kineococcus xinjiangensis]PPK95912.1 hypothetical protein CLV92_1056 [Kineococcus xinjiangensis]